jgi:hypothetical protein
MVSDHFHVEYRNLWIQKFSVSFIGKGSAKRTERVVLQFCAGFRE